MRLTNDLKTLGFEQSHADPCVFRKFVAGKMEAIRVVYVNDLLALTVTKEATENFVGELRSTFKIKDLGEASYTTWATTLPEIGRKRRVEVLSTSLRSDDYRAIRD